MRTADLTLWGLLIVAAVIELIGDLLLKWWADTNRWGALVVGLVLYTIALILFAIMVRRADLSVIFALWTGLAAVLLALAGWRFFGETLTLRRVVGISLVVGGIFILGT
jgi:small multidrug resistance pump